MPLLSQKNTPPPSPSLPRQRWSFILRANGQVSLILFSRNVLNNLFFIGMLRSMNVHKPPLWRIVSACAIQFMFYCSLIIFPRQLYEDCASIKNAYCSICKVIIPQHFNCCARLSTSIINDPLHPHHPCIANALSTSNTLDLLLNSFDVEVLFIETTSSLAWPVFL